MPRITESWEFKTDILTAYNGTEQRICTRKYPRHFLSYDYDAMHLSLAKTLIIVLFLSKSESAIDDI